MNHKHSRNFSYNGGSKGRCFKWQMCLSCFLTWTSGIGSNWTSLYRNKIYHFLYNSTQRKFTTINNQYCLKISVQRCSFSFYGTWNLKPVVANLSNFVEIYFPEQLSAIFDCCGLVELLEVEVEPELAVIW